MNIVSNCVPKKSDLIMLIYLNQTTGLDVTPSILICNRIWY